MLWNFKVYYNSVDKSAIEYKPTVMECYCSSLELYFEKVKMSNVVDKKSRKYLLNAQK